MRRVEACLQETVATEFKLQRGPVEEGSAHPPYWEPQPQPQWLSRHKTST